MERKLYDVYSDHLMNSNFAPKTAGMAALVDWIINHSQVSHLRSGRRMEPKDWWQMVKPRVRNMQEERGFITIYDCIIEQPSADENELISWHYDYSRGRAVKGINFITALYTVDEVSIPVAYRLVTKTDWFTDNQGNRKRRSSVTKSEHFRSLLHTCMRNQIPFRYVLNDIWFASSENMKYIKQKLRKDFIMALKTNRKIALSQRDKRQNRFHKLDQLALPEDTVTAVFLEQVLFPVYLLPQTITNADGSTNARYLVTSDSSLTA